MINQENLIRYIENKIEFVQKSQETSTSDNFKIWADGRLFALKQLCIEFNLPIKVEVKF